MIRIPKHLLSRIREQGKCAYPEECCGFLLGRATDGHKVVNEIQVASNACMVERRRRFLITSDEYRQAETASGVKQLEVLGFYHSHPDHEARPSAYDLEHAWPWFSYVIVSVMKGEPNEISSWVIDDDRRTFAEEKVMVV